MTSYKQSRKNSAKTHLLKEALACALEAQQQIMATAGGDFEVLKCGFKV